jgi:hypothetical protein
MSIIYIFIKKNLKIHSSALNKFNSFNGDSSLKKRIKRPFSGVARLTS